MTNDEWQVTNDKNICILMGFWMTNNGWQMTKRHYGDIFERDILVWDILDMRQRRGGHRRRDIFVITPMSVRWSVGNAFTLKPFGPLLRSSESFQGSIKLLFWSLMQFSWRFSQYFQNIKKFPKVQNFKKMQFSIKNMLQISYSPFSTQELYFGI